MGLTPIQTLFFTAEPAAHLHVKYEIFKHLGTEVSTYVPGLNQFFLFEITHVINLGATHRYVFSRDFGRLYLRCMRLQKRNKILWLVAPTTLYAIHASLLRSAAA